MTDEELKIAIKEINEIGDIVFLKPQGPIDTNTDKLLIQAKDVPKFALGGNTYRAFHRIDENKDGPSEIFKRVLNIKYTEEIVAELKKINDEDGLNKLENKICDELRIELKKHIVNDALIPYNRIRTPVNLFIENLVGLCDAFNNEERIKIIPLLFLPLNKEMFSSPIVFSECDIKKLKLKRDYSMGKITNNIKYRIIQQFLKERAKSLGLKNRIYFDLVWNDKYKNKQQGNNLWSIIPLNRRRNNLIL